LAAGRPIISTRCGEIDNLFKSNNIGYQSADTPKDFSDAILKAFNSNQNKIQGQNARKLAVNELSWSILSNQLVNYYYKNINNPNQLY
jgi:glycosyltransferase involved in cell wall biosynthesis